MLGDILIGAMVIAGAAILVKQQLDIMFKGLMGEEAETEDE